MKSAYLPGANLETGWRYRDKDNACLKLGVIKVFVNKRTDGLYYITMEGTRLLRGRKGHPTMGRAQLVAYRVTKVYILKSMLARLERYQVAFIPF